MKMKGNIDEITKNVNDHLHLENDINKKRKKCDKKSISRNETKELCNVKNEKCKTTVNFVNESDVEETIENIKQEILNQDAEIRMKNMTQFPNEFIIKTEDLISSDSCASETSSPKFLKEKKKKKTAKICAENLEDAVDNTDQLEISEDSFFKQLSQCGLTITWELPELHKAIKHVTRHPSQEVRDEIEKLGLTCRTGHFTAEEDDIIKKNWSRLCEEYKLPNTPEIFGHWRNSTNNLKLASARRAAVMYISRGLPHRTPVQIFHRFVHTLGKTVKGRFSQKEKEIVETFYKTNENSRYTHQYLANILGRDIPSVWRYLKKRKQIKNIPAKKVFWDIGLCEKLVRSLLKLIRPPDEKSWDVNILLNRKITWSEWVSVSKKLDLQPLQLKVQWNSKLYVQLFATQPVYLTTVRLKLLKIFSVEKFKHWQDVSWKAVSSHFENYTNLFLFNIFHTLARTHCPPEIVKDFRGVVNHLHKNFYVDNQKLVNKKLSRFGMNAAGRLFFKSTKIPK